MIPQLIQRGEDDSKRPPLVMREKAGNIFKQQVRRSPGFSQPGNFKEESASGVIESFSFASVRKRLAGESSAQEVEGGQVAGVDLSCIWIVSFLLSNVVDGAIAGVGVLVDLTVADTLKAARAGQSGPKAADPREHIKIANQMVRHLLSVVVQAESRGRCHLRPQPAAARFFLLQRQIPLCAVPHG